MASRAIITTVPDIRLHSPAMMVASMTNSKRRFSMMRPRMVFRMMMKGAAKTRKGIARKLASRTPCSNRRN